MKKSEKKKGIYMIRKMLILLTIISLCGLSGCIKQVGMRKGLVAACGDKWVNPPLKSKLSRIYIGPIDSPQNIPSIYLEMLDGTMIYLPDMKSKDAVLETANLKQFQGRYKPVSSMYSGTAELDNVMNDLIHSDDYDFYYSILCNPDKEKWCFDSDSFGLFLNKATDETFAFYIGGKTYFWNKDKTKRYEFPFSDDEFAELFGKPDSYVAGFGK